jgi:hypothetical protein
MIDRMGLCEDGWTIDWMGGWVDGLDAGIIGCVDELGECMQEWVSGWLDGCVYNFANGWLGE